jgi:DTW domain-containing protein YfiP
MVPTRTRIVILQHPRESRVAINTARIARLCLPNSEIRVGVEWQEDGELADLMPDGERETILLYPGEGAQDIAEIRSTKPVTVVVIDGTWPQARKVFRMSPALAKLPRYGFVPSIESEYRIRSEPRRDFVSTIEALVRVLGVLEEDPDLADALMRPFRAMVDFQITCEEQFHARRTRQRSRPTLRKPVVPELLVERESEMVCVAGEVNAWPGRGTALHETELVHWVACRLRGGERFEQVIAPRNPLAPNTPFHIDLPRERLLAGCDRAAFATAWRSFAREGDVLCSWGYFALKLFCQATGLALAEHVELRGVAKQWSKRRWASAAEFHDALLGKSAPPGEGRAGRNLERLIANTRFLIEKGIEERSS